MPSSWPSLILSKLMDRLTITKDTPVDAVIMAIIDSLEVDGQVVFRK
jgi:microcompartment protein CcmK/EutM